jgi:hypothetical protein
MVEPRKPPLPGGPLRIQQKINPLSSLSPKAWLVFLCVFFVALLAIWFYLRQIAAGGDAAGASRTRPAKVLPPEGAPLDIEGVPTLDPAKAETVRDETPEERRKPSREALEYLMLEARQTPAVRWYDRGLLPLVRGLADEMERDPRPHRFKFYRFRGKLERLEECFGEEGAHRPAMEKYFRGLVLLDPRTPQLRVTFYTPHAPEYRNEQLPVVSPPVELITDGWVRGRGIFLQRHLDVTPDGREVPSLLLVVTLLERDYETRPVESLDDVGFEVIRDDPALWATPEAPLLRRPYALTLLRLVKYAEARAGEAGRARREAEGLTPASFDTRAGYDGLMAAPAENRGRYFGGLGALIDEPLVKDMESDRRIEPNDAGVESYALGYLYTDGGFVVFYVAPTSVVAGLRKNARVAYEGFFYKNMVYTAASGEDLMVPWLVLTSLREIRPQLPGVKGQLIFAAIFVLVIAAVIFWVVREDRTKREYRARRSRRVVKPRPDPGG